jgi:hypothetical protein
VLHNFRRYNEDDTRYHGSVLQFEALLGHDAGPACQLCFKGSKEVVMREYYVMTVKVASGADKFLVVFDHDEHGLMIYDRWDNLKGALAAAESLNRE